jgi:FtsP/CotA-like multicopper oxidase with cupredoxin domain
MTNVPVPEGEERSSWSLIWQIWVSLLVVTALVFGVFAVTHDDEAAGEATGAASTPAASTASSQVMASLGEFFVKLDGTATAGHVTVHVMNDGTTTHNLALVGSDSVTTGDLTPGSREVLDLGDLKAGKYELHCTIPGHESSGMKATLTVTEASSTATADESTTATTAMDHAAMQKAMIDSFAPFPAATDGTGNAVLAPTVLADGTKQFELTAEVTPFEVEPGKVVQAWNYNGQVPGPVIKADVGDRVAILVHNRLPIGTDVHFHGIRTPFEDDGVAPITQDVIEPGADWTYTFTVEEPAVGMYHAHLAGQTAVPNGLLGTFLVGQMPLPETLPGGAGLESAAAAPTSVAQELPMVLNDTGVIGLSINGKSFPATQPIVARNGDWLMIHYENEGVQSHPMHLHQFPQLVIAKDGLALDHPYWADTILVGPGERYTVLVHADRPGTWVWHCHILNHVERESGMFGMVTALVVQ